MTTDRSRDESIERLLRQRSRDEDALPTGACLDADVLAGWADDGLYAGERKTAEAHAAGCSRCQALLAAMIRTEPAPPSRPWWRAAPLRWLAPVAAAATAVALWVAVAPQPRDTAPAATANEAKAEPPALPEAPAAPAAAPRPTDAARDRLERVEPKEVARLPEAPAAAPPAALADRSEADAKAVARRADRPDAPLTGQAAEQAAAVPLKEEGPASHSNAMGFAAVPEIFSPEPAYRWRTPRAGLVERSIDGGRNWTPQATGEPATDVTAGSSPSRDVVWLVGRNGAVLLSTDGRTWQHRRLPDAADLVAVRSSDATTATVTTRDGRQFSTNDGGLTWTPLPLQEIAAAPFYQ